MTTFVSKICEKIQILDLKVVIWRTGQNDVIWLSGSHIRTGKIICSKNHVPKSVVFNQKQI